ncbi:Flp pilus assembly protein CpaB [Phenylobacterium sp.]|uniref:Flp pilus assembly protein CpaB n=1 Tax=Phenylobacterium sp. TaxID=1871053 RepID=UPI0025E2D3E3|nr:Flp pilus assembly protein CpaB [Phenylobacterium sp.]MBX3481914.1 Flp pilus assembly protein CpaB [Phenylobacterium sp.]MCW5760095.1 Flp pilus assembly protein CpaB [Phenylobacterium sp.]
MRLVTIASLGASAVLGLGALFVAKIALPNAASAKGAQPRVEQAGQPIVVASRAIKYGEKLEAGMLTVIKVPQNAVPAGSYATVDLALQADHGAPPVVLTPIAQREALLPAKLSGPGARPTVAAELEEGKRAYAVKVDDATGVGGHALPGDRVDVVLMRDLTPDGPTRNFISYVVVQNARVLGIDLNADPTSDKPASPNTATIEVSVEDSQKLSIASTLGTLSLALRRNGEAAVAAARPMRTADFLSGGQTGAVRTVYRGPVRSYGILIVEGAPSKRERGASSRKASASPAPKPVLPQANAADALS